MPERPDPGISNDAGPSVHWSVPSIYFFVAFLNYGYVYHDLSARMPVREVPALFAAIGWPIYWLGKLSIWVWS